MNTEEIDRSEIDSGATTPTEPSDESPAASPTEPDADAKTKLESFASSASLASSAADATSVEATASNSFNHVNTPNLNRLLDVELDVVVRFGVTSLPLNEIARLGVGAMIELNRGVDEPVELLINNRVFASGEVVVVDGYYGVRVLEVAPADERAMSLI